MLLPCSQSVRIALHFVTSDATSPVWYSSPFLLQLPAAPGLCNLYHFCLHLLILIPTDRAGVLLSVTVGRGLFHKRILVWCCSCILLLCFQLAMNWFLFNLPICHLVYGQFLISVPDSFWESRWLPSSPI